MADLNPYTPGAGTRPSVLAGRQAQLALVRSLAEQVEAGRQPTPIIYTGLRGMGKTSLLYEARDELRERGWLAGYYEVRRDVEAGVAIRSIVADSAQMSTGRLRKALERGAHHIGALRLVVGPAGVAFEVDATRSAPAGDPDPYPELVAFLRSLARDAKANGVGVALIIDELQVFRKRDLAVLVQALSALRDEPVVLIGAGLPYVSSEMAKANTYAERFRFDEIASLNEGDAREAVEAPAFKRGTLWDAAALDHLVGESDGYPYFLQLFASEAWNASHGAARITSEHLNRARAAVQRQLDVGLYAARYDRLSEREREYVDAMVQVMEQGSVRANSGRVAAELGLAPSAAGPVRDRVIKKGIIHSPQYGMLEFSVPGFAEYVARRAGGRIL